jgi:autoinducer 2-degrading protein
MITRLVKLTLIPSKAKDFVDLFMISGPEINGFPGCRLLKLYKDINKSHIIFTYSEWDSEADLNNYRNSEFFKDLWKKARTCFSAPAQAWSLNEH